MDTQLRDLLETAVGEPPHAVDLTVVRRRVRYRRWAETTAAAVGALALLAGLGVVIGGARAAGPGQPETLAARAGTPAYYVQQVLDPNPALSTRVVSTATGAVTATVRCPWRGAIVPPRAIVPAGNGIFFAGCEQGAEPGRTPYPNVTTRLYRFGVTAAGRVTGFSLVPGGELGRVRIYRMGAAAGGAEVAVALGPAAAKSAASERVVVIDTRTGAHGTWFNDAGTAGMVLSYLDDFSLTSNGRELAFVTQVRCGHGAGVGTGAGACVAGREVRAVSPALAGGQLTSSHLLFRTTELPGLSAGNLNDARLDPSGSMLTVLVYHQLDRGGDSIVSVLRVSAVTGRQLAVLYRVNTPNYMLYESVSPDPTGRYIMLDTGSSAEAYEGWIYHGRLIPMIPHDRKDVYYQVW